MQIETIVLLQVACRYVRVKCPLSRNGEFLSDDYPIFWRVTANIPNKQSRTAVNGWSFGCGVWGEVKNYL
jgi:hypothetical protein